MFVAGKVRFPRFDVKTWACGPPSAVAHGTKVDSQTPVVMRFARPEMINAVLGVDDPESTAAGRTTFEDTVTVIVLTAEGKAER